MSRPALLSILGAVALLFLVIAAIVSSGGSSQASVPSEITPRSVGDNTELGYWTPMGVKNRTGDDSFQDPGLNQSVYALVKYGDTIYAGGLFDDTGGGGNNEANCSDDAEYPLQCIAQWSPVTNAWTPVGAGLNNEVKTLTIMNNKVYAGGLFDDTVGGPGLGVCKPAPGIRWVMRSGGPTASGSWSSVVWGDDSTGIIGDDEGFVAVASAGETRVMTSPNGVTWTGRTAPVASWSSVTWGDDSTAIDLNDDTFVAVASSSEDSRVMTSPDGVTWIGRAVPSALSDDSWSSVAWGDSTPSAAGGAMFVAVASAGAERVMTSPDGVTWTARSAAASNAWTSVAYGANKFVAVASAGDDTRVMYSSDGVTWNRPTGRVPVLAWESVAWGNGRFVAVASNGDDTTVMTSEDGLKWAVRAGSAYPNQWKSVVWAGNMFVAVGRDDTAPKPVMVSPEGVTWSTRTTGALANTWQSVARGDAGGAGNPSDDTVVAVASSGSQRVMTSVAADSPGELRCISVWNGSTWSPLGGGLDGGPTALAALDDSTLVVSGGGFEDSNPDAYPTPWLDGLVAYRDDVDSWISPPYGVGGFQTLAESLVVSPRGDLYIGGGFQGDFGKNDESMVPMTFGVLRGIGRMVGSWDDTASWSPMASGFKWLNSGSEEPGRIDALAFLDGRVYAGGYVNRTGDDSPLRGNLFSWTGTSWSSVGSGLNSDDTSLTSVRALASDDTRGLLYVGGTFDDTYGGGGNGICDDTDIAVGPLRCVTVWDEGIDEFIPFQWGSLDDSNGLTGEVKAFVVDDSVVYVGGSFNTWPEGGFDQVWNLKNVGKWTWLPPTGSVNTSASGGQTVTITGTRFIGVPSGGVRFGSTSVPFTRSSTESITATVPTSLASGTYTISVNGVGGWADVGTVAVTNRSGGGGGSSGGTPAVTPTPKPTPSASATATPPATSSGPTAAQLQAVAEVRPGRVSALSRGVPPGQAIVIVNGRKVKSILTVGSRGMTVRSGPITQVVQTQSGRGANLAPVNGSLSIPRAEVQTRARRPMAPRVQLSSSGYAPLTPVRVYLIPQPVGGPSGGRVLDLGYVMTDAQGRVQSTVSARVRTPGSYILQINGKGSDGAVRSINLPAVVRR